MSNDSINYHDYFVYQNGKLYWKVRPREHFVSDRGMKSCNSKRAGKEAGYIDAQGYVRVRVNDKSIGAHRVIYFMHHGHMPEFVDHIDGNPTNNIIENLRAATIEQNMQNCKTPVTNTSGFKGVYFHPRIGKYTASIRVNKKLTHLGTFGSMQEAIDARKKAEIEHYGDFRKNG